MGYDLDRQDSILNKDKRSFPYSAAFSSALEPTKPNQRIPDRLPLPRRVKLLGREAYDSPPSNVEVKIGGLHLHFPIRIYDMKFNCLVEEAQRQRSP